MNYEWHQPTILGWKDVVFYGEDKEYNGKDGFTYVSNHLGYRFILRKSVLPDLVSMDGVLPINIEIENVGFANLPKNKKVTFVLTNGINVYEIEPDTEVNPCGWLSGQTSAIETSIKVPENIEAGEYDLFLRVSEFGNLASDGNQYCIKFGNSSMQYNAQLGANLIGSLAVIDKNSSNSACFSTTPLYFIEGKELHVSECDELNVYSAKGICQTKIT